MIAFPVYNQSVYRKATDHLNLKLCIFSGQAASFKNGVSKVQDFGNFELSPVRKTLRAKFSLYSMP